jgi:hypothetical protein
MPNRKLRIIDVVMLGIVGAMMGIGLLEKYYEYQACRKVKKSVAQKLIKAGYGDYIDRSVMKCLSKL